MPLPTFVFNDETKRNSHGFFLKNSGGRFERFRENPVMLDNHNDDRLIGRWKGPRIEGCLLVADPEFDEGVALGAERQGQVERGFLKGASPGIMPLKAEYIENAITGEGELHVTEWELIEGSVTPIPSNAGALALAIYGSDRQPIADKDVALHLDNIVKLGAQTYAGAPGEISNTKKMEKILLTAAAVLALGINENADGTAISEAIVKLHKDKTDLAAKVTAHEQAETARITAEATAKVDLAIEKGKATADTRAELIQLAIDNPTLFDKLVGTQPEKVSLAAAIKPIAGDSVIPSDRANWTHLKWLKEDPKGLESIKLNHPEAFEQIKQVRN